MESTKFTIWDDGESFGLAEGNRVPLWMGDDSVPAHQIESPSWDEAVRQYHEWLDRLPPLD